MNKHTLRNGELQRDGVALHCPFVPPIPTPGRVQNTVTLVRMPCNQNCSLFELVTEVPEVPGGASLPFALLHCASTRIVNIDEIIEPEKFNVPAAPPSKIVPI